MISYGASVVLVASGTGLAASVLGGLVPEPLALVALLVSAAGHVLAVRASVGQLRDVLKRNDRGIALGRSASSADAVGEQGSDTATIPVEDFGIRAWRDHDRVTFDIKLPW